MEFDPKQLHVGGKLTKEQLKQYNYDHTTLLYTGIMETLMRYYTISSRQRLAVKWHLGTKPWHEPPPRFEDLIPSAVKAWFRQRQREERQQILQPLELAGIPANIGLVDVLDMDGDKKSWMGDRIWMYESRILKCFVPINMNHRWRGARPGTPALKSIYFLNMLDAKSQAEENKAMHQAVTNKKLRSDPFNRLKTATKNEAHYKFLKALAAAQVVTLPFSIQETCLDDVVPSFELVLNYYTSYMTEKNQKVQEVLAHRSRLFEVWEKLKQL